MRLRLEKRRAEREDNFESAALILGLTERNLAAKEEGYDGRFVWVVDFDCITG